jgi:hypothetical protein
MLPVVYIWRIHCRWWPVAKQTWRLEAVSYITLVLIRVVRWSNGPATRVKVPLARRSSNALLQAGHLRKPCQFLWSDVAPPPPFFSFSHWCKWSGNRLGCSLFINKALRKHTGGVRLDDAGRPELPGETCCACGETEQAQTSTSTKTLWSTSMLFWIRAFACPLMSDELSHSILAASTRVLGNIESGGQSFADQDKRTKVLCRIQLEDAVGPIVHHL